MPTTSSFSPSVVRPGDTSIVSWSSDHPVTCYWAYDDVFAGGPLALPPNGSGAVGANFGLKKITYSFQDNLTGGYSYCVLAIPDQAGPPLPPPPPIPVADLTNVLWANWYSVGMPASVAWAPEGYPIIGELHYVVYPFSNLLAASAIRFAIAVTNNTLVPVQAYDPPPAKIQLFFGTQDTTWAHLRFWSDAFVNVDKEGIVEMTVPIDPAVWHTVDGTKDAGSFASLLSGSAYIGWTCGGQSTSGHGIKCTPTGSSGLILKKFHVLS